MTSIAPLSPVLFFQTPIDAAQTYNGSTQVDGVPTEFGSCRGRYLNLNSDAPAAQYQTQKIIQKTVRMYASLYTANLASLSAYQHPPLEWQSIEQSGSIYTSPPGVNWNQMSDRARPSVQKVVTHSGSALRGSSTKHTIVSNRPGAMSPGGIGCDIKHNSYERYLNRIKARKPLRRGIIPPDYGLPIPFNRAYPIYGGKTVKTGTVNGCDCPVIKKDTAADKLIYGSPLSAIQDLIFNVKYQFNVGDFVWSKKLLNSNVLYKAQIINSLNNIFLIQFVDGTQISTISDNLMIYFECNCGGNESVSLQDLLVNGALFGAESKAICSLLNVAGENFLA